MNVNISVMGLLGLLLLGACGNAKTISRERMTEEAKEMVIQLNGQKVHVIWEDNDAVGQLREEVQKKVLEVKLRRYGNHEQVGSLGKNYPRNDCAVEAKPGDIMLYQGNQIVLFYDNHSWDYTKLGKVSFHEWEKVKEILRQKSVTLKILLEDNLRR